MMYVIIITDDGIAFIKSEGSVNLTHLFISCLKKKTVEVGIDGVVNRSNLI